MIQLEHSFLDLSSFFYSHDPIEKVVPKKILLFNDELASELGFDRANRGLSNEDLLAYFSGQKLFDETKPPYSMAYSGHQFGHFNPMLGDGRAHVLGEVIDKYGLRHDLQLKGSGKTSFSRRGDGRSWVGPVIREYLVSEYMNSLGIPTTRALCALETYDQVERDEVYPGGILTRVARSHLRVGTIEYAARDFEKLKELVDYVIKRHYPELQDAEYKYFSFFESVARSFIRLVNKWMAVGFIHGVMNTDNTSLCGITLDYGPCAFMDTYRSDKAFSSIDQYGRYGYGNQPQIALWNMSVLASALFDLFKSEGKQDEKLLVKKIQNEFTQLENFSKIDLGQQMGKKFGFKEIRPGDSELIEEYLAYLETAKLDFTLSFRNLSNYESENTVFLEKLRNRHLKEFHNPEEAKSIMRSANPLFIARNHHIQKAIDLALEGELSYLKFLERAYRKPFDEGEFNENTEYQELARAPRASEIVYHTFCGT